jgi:hypothetical protein
MNDMLEELKSKGVMEESDSPWSSPVVLVWKKYGIIHFCIDCRIPNYLTKRTAFCSQ